MINIDSHQKDELIQDGDVNDHSIIYYPSVKRNDQTLRDEKELFIISTLERHGKFLLMPVLPLLWCVFFMTIMDREKLSTSYAMPILGIVSATLANAVPVGGGIVFVPILSLFFGIDLSLGASFAVATMTFGNGIFGFLSWITKDPSSIIWSVVPYAVLPAWVGAAWFTLHPFLDPARCRQLFALFSFLVASIVARGVYVSSKKISEGKTEFSIQLGDNSNSDNDGNKNGIQNTWRQIIISCLCSFTAGSVLVAHIGIGNAMTTFLVCSFVWKLPAKKSVVTGILVGGWTSLIPFLIHLIVLQDVPITLWVMVLPGVYLGARLAPLVHERIGITTVLFLFCVFLLIVTVILLM